MDAPVMLITGASSGIGAAIARDAAEHGYRLLLVARSAERLAALADELGGPTVARSVVCDVTDWSQQSRLVDTALDAFGRLDVVVVNAGFGAPSGFTKSTPEHWRAMILTNFYGAALTVRSTFEHIRRNGGHVVFSGSVAGRKALPGSLYSCTKWALTAMAEGLRQELAGSDARVTIVQPGIVDTPFFAERQAEDTPVHGDAQAGEAPLAARDVARAVLYALEQPRHIAVNEIVLRPAAQRV